jgi:hypothetical protein
MDSMTFARPPMAGSETELLLGILDRNRSVVAWKCGGLDAAGLRATLGSSSVTLGGLLKHLALVEDHYFSVTLTGSDPAPPWDGVNFDVDPEWEWRTAADDTPDELFALWWSAVERSRTNVAAALNRGDLGQLIQEPGSTREPASLRRVLVDLIEEYARHSGHADLLRESVDGLVGEEPPRDNSDG